MWSPLLDCNSACGRKRCTAVSQRPDEIVELLGRHRPVDAAAAFGQVGAEVVRRNAVGDTYPSTDLIDRRRVGTRTCLPGARRSPKHRRPRESTLFAVAALGEEAFHPFVGYQPDDCDCGEKADADPDVDGRGGEAEPSAAVAADCRTKYATAAASRLTP